MKPLFRFGVVAVVGVASALTGTSAVHAKESGATRAPASLSTVVSTVVSTSAASTVAEQNRITRYWTSARMKAAKAGEALAPKRSILAGRSAVVAGKPTTVGATAAKDTVAALSTGDPYTGGGAVVRTTGKVFFTLGGSDYVCSGSAVTSTNKDTVLTAGHCVHEGPGSFATNWAFVPGYSNGNRPFGTFTARRLLTTTAWARRGDFNYDVGFALMNAVSGKDLTDTVGGQGIAFNQSRGKYMYAFGYPAASPYDGSDLIHCDGTVFQDTYGNSTDQGMNCDMTGGSSGGPWFYNFNTSTGAGTLNSVNSFGYTGLDDVMWGPYFGSTISSLYNTAKTG